MLRLLRHKRRHQVYLKRDEWTSSAPDLYGMWPGHHFGSVGGVTDTRKKKKRSQSLAGDNQDVEPVTFSVVNGARSR